MSAPRGNKNAAGPHRKALGTHAARYSKKATVPKTGGAVAKLHVAQKKMFSDKTSAFWRYATRNGTITNPYNGPF
jgi:hypothetical protein